MPPDKDQNQTAPGAAPTQEQSQTPQSEQPVSQEPPGQFTPPVSDIPVGPQEPTVPPVELGQPLADTPQPSPGPTVPGPTTIPPEPGPALSSEPTVIGPESGPVFPPPTPPTPPTSTPQPIIGPTPPIEGMPKSGGNTMKKIRLLLILIPILVFLFILIFVATSFLGKTRLGKGTKATPTPTARAVQPSEITPGGFAKIPTPTPTLVAGIYRDPTYGFSLEPPTGWVQEKGTGFVNFRNPKEEIDSAGNKLNANLLISQEILPAGQTFDSYIEQKRNELTVFPEYQKISEVKGTLAGRPAFQIDLTWRLGPHNVRQRLVRIQKDQNACLLTATSTAATWDRYQPIFEKSISSFAFTVPSI